MSLPGSRPTSRQRAKAAPGGVGSALALERRCGFRLRQVRRAEMTLGTYDVMRLADAEFGLRVSREIARQWLELCGAAAPCCELLRIESAEEIERRFGPFLRGSGVDFGMTVSDERLVEAFLGFFPHVRAPVGVLRLFHGSQTLPTGSPPLSSTATPFFCSELETSTLSSPTW